MWWKDGEKMLKGTHVLVPATEAFTEAFSEQLSTPDPRKKICQK